MGPKQSLHPPTKLRVRCALAFQKGSSRGWVRGRKSRLENILYTFSVQWHGIHSKRIQLQWRRFWLRLGKKIEKVM
jgi:hypothetical protein